MPIPASPDLVTSAFANTGDKIAPPQTDPNGFVNFTQGYGPDYEIDLNSGNSAAKAVERKIQNYLFYLLTGVAKSWQATSIAPWYSTMPSGYPKGAIVGRVSAGGTWQVWRSLVEGNVVDPNTSNQTSWEYIPFNMESLKSVAMPAGGVAQITPGGQATELVAVATDFNSFTTGTWEFKTDTIANGSANSPVSSGASTAYAGMLEAKQWTDGTNTYNVQRYCDRTGILFFRGATNGTWTAWSSGNASSGATSYSTDTGTVNAVQGNAVIASGAIADNQAFWVKIANANTGATTFSPNTSVAAAPLVGQDYNPLQGGELVVGGRILVIYRASVPCYVLVSNVGGALPVPNGTKANQSVNKAQLDTKVDSSQVNGATAISWAGGAAIKTGTGGATVTITTTLATGDLMQWTDSSNANVAHITQGGGLGFYSKVVSSYSDLSKHLDLYGGIVGLSVTSGHLNYVVNNVSNHDFYSGNLHTLVVGQTGELSVPSGGIFVAGVSGDCISMGADRLGATNMYGFGNESNYVYAKAPSGHRWYISANADGGTSSRMTLTTSGLTVLGTGNFTGSDRRLKKDIKEFKPRPLHRRVKLHSYRLRDTNEPMKGCIAQDLLAAEPDYTGKVPGTDILTANNAALAQEIAMWAANEVDKIKARARRDRLVFAVALLVVVVQLIAKAM